MSNLATLKMFSPIPIRGEIRHKNIQFHLLKCFTSPSVCNVISVTALYDSKEEFKVFSNEFKDVVKIPLELIKPQYYSETGYRFTKQVTAFYISIEE